MLCPDSYLRFKSAASLSRSPPVTRLPFLSSTTFLPSASDFLLFGVSPAGCSAITRFRYGGLEGGRSGDLEPGVQQVFVAPQPLVDDLGRPPAVVQERVDERSAGAGHLRRLDPIRR